MEPNAQQRAGNENAVAKANAAGNNLFIAGSGLTNGTASGGLQDNSFAGLQQQKAYPNVCPGCGRCKDCGQPYPQPNPYLLYIRYVPLNTPYWGTPVITCGGTLPTAGLGTVTINSHNTADGKPIYPISQTNPY